MSTSAGWGRESDKRFMSDDRDLERCVFSSAGADISEAENCVDWKAGEVMINWRSYAGEV
jgi:hypothetical protein